LLVTIADVLSPEQVALCHEALASAAWVDGRRTAGHQSGRVKRNQQINGDDPAARKLQEIILHALERSAGFVSAALPLKVFPPLFNRYAGGEAFGTHFDNAIMQLPGTPHRLRSDLSATLFLSDPAEYDGGELVVEDTYGAHAVKLLAGHMVLYPASSLHRVTPVTRGERLAAFFWIQSMVRDDGHRTLLYDFDTAIRHVAAGLPEHPAVVQLTGVYHNLLRGWAET
jgi:PKHD-type hydroxylase